jgi:predicted dithiol-disulfide oxidoreductase (DUF899 family)
MTGSENRYPAIVSREEWREARLALLEKEKAHMRAGDELNAERRRLPMVEIDEEYVFDGPAGEATLLDLFEGRRQLLVYHFMFHPDWEDGCPTCTSGADEISEGLVEHLHNRDTTFAYVSRAPLPKLQRYKEHRGWTVPWYSSYGSSFNYDFHVTLDASVAPIEYNYRSAEEHERAGSARALQGEQPLERHGYSCFLRDGDRVFHTYSTYARGVETVGWSAYDYLDVTALGRQESWEKPKGRVAEPHGPSPNLGG